MAHSQETVEAVEAPVSHTVDSAAAALSQRFQTPDEEEQEEEFADDELPEDGEEYEGEEIDEDEEPVEAIPTPASLTADEKAVYASLTPEAQEFVSRLEQRRNQDVTKVTTKAAETQRQAEARMQTARQEAEAMMAQQLRAFTAQYAPQEPDPSQFRDIATYQRARQIYEQDKAHHNQIVEQISAIGKETEEQKAQRIQQRDLALMQIPEIANEETRKPTLDAAFSLAKEFGWDEAELADTIDANEMNFLVKAAKWRADSEELAKVRKRAKARKRDGQGRFKSLRPGTAQPDRSGNRAYSQAKERLAKTGSLDDAQAAFKAALTQGN